MKFENEITIKKLSILRNELDVLMKERDKNEKIFNDLCDALDTPISGRNVEEATIQLSILLDRSNVIYEKLHILNAVFSDLRSELTN